MRTTLLFTALIALLFTACNKNQRRVVKLDGKWNVISATIEGYGESNPDLMYEFEYCKLKHNDLCDFAIHNFETNEVTEGLYEVKDQGNTISMTVSSAFGFSYREYDVIKLSNRKLILQNHNAPNGELSRIELKAVNN